MHTISIGRFLYTLILLSSGYDHPFSFILCTNTDSDGDRVVISSDDELTDALDQFDGSVFKLHVKSEILAH